MRHLRAGCEFSSLAGRRRKPADVRSKRGELHGSSDLVDAFGILKGLSLKAASLAFQLCAIPLFAGNLQHDAVVKASSRERSRWS